MSWCYFQHLGGGNKKEEIDGLTVRLHKKKGVVGKDENVRFVLFFLVEMTEGTFYSALMGVINV